MNIIGQKYGRLTVIQFAEYRMEGNRSRPYWLCECECHKQKIVSEASLRREKGTKSCGCIVKENNSKRQARLEPSLVVLNQLINSYKSGAKRRGYSYELTDNEFYNLTQQNCFYCGIEPKQVKKYLSAKIVYNGIDRVDNELGYITGNCVPCCIECNTMKMSMSLHEFIQKIKKIIDRYQNKE